MIDNGTSHNIAAKIPNKESSFIVKYIFKYWISYFGKPSYFCQLMVEFNKQEFGELAKNLNIVVRTTTVHTPWHNFMHVLMLFLKIRQQKQWLRFSVILIFYFYGIFVQRMNDTLNGYRQNQLMFARN